MDTIDWHEETFIPYVKVGGYERNIYQLSASEKVLVYFSIRAALLSHLTPDTFLVIDNLLGPFMKEKQQIIGGLLRDVIDNTNVKQIIFTGFDVDITLDCENKISLG